MASVKYDYAEMIWYEIKEAAEQDRVALLPVATYEDHGPHLPVDVDVDSETHYAVKSGVAEGDNIVTGSYKAISRELQHGMLVTVGDWSEKGPHNKQFGKTEDDDDRKKDD